MATIFEPPPPYSQQPSLQEQILNLKAQLAALTGSVAAIPAAYSAMLTGTVATAVGPATILASAGPAIDAGLVELPSGTTWRVPGGEPTFYTITMHSVNYSGAGARLRTRVSQAAAAISDITGDLAPLSEQGDNPALAGYANSVSLIADNPNVLNLRTVTASNITSGLFSICMLVLQS